jgi:hypothetical protein
LPLLFGKAESIAQLCYKQEGDDYLAPTTTYYYDHWNSTLLSLQNRNENIHFLQTNKVNELYQQDQRREARRNGSVFFESNAISNQ